MCTSPGAPSTLGKRSSASPSCERSRFRLTPAFVRRPTHAAALLLEQRRHHVHGLDELMIAADGERLRIGQRLLELGRQLVHAHY